MRLGFVSAAAFLLIPLSLAADTVTTPHVVARIVSDAAAVAPGSSFGVGLDFTLKKGWHTYWKNPGDSGEPMKVTWKVSPGLSAGPLSYPPPELIQMPPLANFGYKDQVLIFSDMAAGADLTPGGSIEIQADATWLVCEETCIPEKGSFSITLPVAAASSPGPDAPRFQAARERLPKPVSAARVEVSDKGLYLAFPEGIELPEETSRLFFFPETPGVIKNAAEQVAFKDRGRHFLRLVPDPGMTKPPERLTGVLVTGEKAYALGELPDHPSVVALPPRAASRTPAEVPSGETAPAVKSEAPGLTAARAVPFAFLGGLLLNLMPCVFPVLSVKVLGFLKKSGGDHRRARTHGWAYAAGVVLSFGVLAAALLFLRWSGEALGWGFQLQSPLFVLLMIFLLFLLALSLLGLFEIGGSLMGVGSKLAGQTGLSGSFFTGVLATVVATPCTAPFMGPAVGFALAQPAAMALAVFLAVGVGMALPYLVLTHVPALLWRLPKPGPWMETFQQAMAFPLLATVVWLLWVIGRQAPGALVTILLALLALSFGVWLGRRVRRARPVALLIAAAAVAWAVVEVRGEIRGAASALATTAGWEAFSERRISALRAEGRPVFVDFTAAWCLTCQVNKKTVLEREDVRRAFSDKNVALIEADWTNQDAAISKALEAFGRQGVPLYVYYPPGGEAKVLPALLTKAIVLESLENQP
ncbi:MAG TPA: thioredoxin family protein [bacterium]|nr:thioredoxin family protein [bacterium]